MILLSRGLLLNYHNIFGTTFAFQNLNFERGSAQKPALTVELGLERMHRPLTRREARWVSRLYPIILNLNEGKLSLDRIWWIQFWVLKYTLREQEYQIKHGENIKDFETFELDLDLIQSKGEPERATIRVMTPMELFNSPENAKEENQEDYKIYLKHRMNPCPFENPVKEMTEEDKERIKQAISEAAKEAVRIKSEEDDNDRPHRQEGGK